MSEGGETARREAAEWHMLLREAPEDANLRSGFAAWRDADACHDAAWRSMDRTFTAISAVGAHDGFVDDSVAEDLMAAIAPPRMPRRGRWVAAGMLAACLALLAVTRGPEVAVRLAADHATAAAETAELSLADGSIVRLAPESALSVAFTDDRREVHLLSGMAHFTVVRDPARPFAVVADGITATVLGTAFDVVRRDEEVSVAVSGGHVRVTGAGETADLRSGDWLRVGRDRAVATGQVPADLVGDWWSGRLMVRDRSIAAVAVHIGAWFPGAIVLLDGDLGARRVTGVYDPRDPAAALAALVSPYGGTVRQITPWLLVVSGG